MFGRIVDTAAAVKLAARVLPASWRFVKRYPLSASLVIAGLALVAYSWRVPERFTSQSPKSRTH